AARQVSAEDIDPRHRWDRPLQAAGGMQEDVERSVDFRRLHSYRLGRWREGLAAAGLGAGRALAKANSLYLVGRVMCERRRDTVTRGSWLSCWGEPWVWDCGAAARHDRL